MRALAAVKTDVARGPRGDYYEWCRLLENGTLEFGREEGNYAGGPTLSYWFYGDRSIRHSESHPITEDYWDEAVGVLIYLEDKDPEYYRQIIDMCKAYSFPTLSKIERIIANRKKGIAVNGNGDKYSLLKKDREKYDEKLNELIDLAKPIMGWLKKQSGAYTQICISKTAITAFSDSITIRPEEGEAE